MKARMSDVMIGSLTLALIAGALGGVNVLPPTLLLQYYFNAAGKVRPYVGAGVNYTLFYNNGLHAGDTPVSIKNSSFGPALQAGVDVQVARKGVGWADKPWTPPLRVAEMRQKKV